jgi:hypothetical protein
MLTLFLFPFSIGHQLSANFYPLSAIFYFLLAILLPIFLTPIFLTLNLLSHYYRGFSPVYPNAQILFSCFNSFPGYRSLSFQHLIDPDKPVPFIVQIAHQFPKPEMKLVRPFWSSSQMQQ